MLCRIETKLFFFWSNTKWQDEVDELENQERHSECIYCYDRHRLQLRKEECRITIEPSLRAAWNSMYQRSCKYTCQQHTYHTSYSVTWEYVECVVECWFLFDSDNYVRYKCSNKTNNYTLRNAYITRGRSYGYQSNDCTNAETEHWWLFTLQYIEEHPGQTCWCSCCVCCSERVNRKWSCSNCWTSVKTEPTKPK